MAKEGTQREAGVTTRTRVKKPPLYKVLLHNDDYTTQEFVVWILQTVFHHDETTATRIMLHVHQNGIGVAGVYGREIAETRAARTEQLARSHEYPLRCTLDEEEG